MSVSPCDKYNMIKRQFEFQRRNLRTQVRAKKLSKEFADHEMDVWKAILLDYLIERGQYLKRLRGE